MYKYFIQKATYFCIFLLVFGQFQPVFASVSKSSNFQLINGQVNPVVGRASKGDKNLKGGGRSIAGRANSSNFESRQGSIFGFKKTQTTQQQTSPNKSTGGGGGGSSFAVAGVDKYQADIDNLSVVRINTSSAEISFETKSDTRSAIEYGTDDGISTSTNFGNDLNKKHRFKVEDLLPNTSYLFQIFLENSQDQTDRSKIYSFTTLPEFGTPASVSNFNSSLVRGTVVLTWNNPDIEDFRTVKIVKSTESYPTTLNEGQLIFSGKQEYFVDSKVDPGQEYFYTAFVIDTSKNRSSGAVESVKIPRLSEEREAETQEPKEKPEDKKPADEPSELEPDKESEEDEKPTPEEPDMVDEVKEKIKDEDVIDLSPLEIKKKIEETIEGITKKEKKKEKEKEEVEIKIQDRKPKEYEVTVPAKPPPIPDIAVPTPKEEKSGAEQDMNMFTLLKQEVSGNISYLSRQAKKISSSTREEVNKIKEGLVSASGELKGGIYQQLSEEKKRKVNKLLTKGKTPTKTPETTAKVIPHTLKAERAGADWHIYSDSKAMFTIPADTFKKPVKSITVTVDDKGYVLQYNKNTDNYEALIEAPSKKGKYEMIVQIFYKDDTYEQLKKTVLVDPYGKVYKEVFRDWSWYKPWQIFTTKKVAVSNAKVTLYSQNPNGKWVKWPGHLYNQYNPQFTSKDGDFSFVAPPGKYYLTANADGFEKVKTDKFEIEDKIINKNIKLEARWNIYDWATRIIFGIIILSALGFITSRVYFKKDSKRTREDNSKQSN
ncbi:MAG: hypothetical protein ABEJ24_05015 [Candidatus Magasanikbacteria bacterium]